MVVYFGADHRGFKLKEILKAFLKEQGYEAVDLGALAYDKDDDYPDFGAAVGRKVSADPENSRGIVICGSGVGIGVAANKFKGVRAALGMSPQQIHDSRSDEDVNVLSISADFTSEEQAKALTKTFLETPFGAAERYRRRLDKIAKIEES